MENQNPCIFPINQTLQTHTQQPIHNTLRPRFLPNLFVRQPIHRKPKPLHFSHKPNTANPYTANPHPFFSCYAIFTEIGFAVFFSQKPNKTICLVSVKKTQQTHALFLLFFNRKQMLSIPLHLFIFLSFSSTTSLPVDSQPTRCDFPSLLLS